MNECIFCKIIKKEIPAEIVFEDDKSIAFLDINPVREGHILLIPKEHFPQMIDTPDDSVSRLFLQTKRLMKAVKKAMSADYVALSVIGIDVPHFHIHLVPRNLSDGLANLWPTIKYTDANHAKKVGDQIRSAL